MAALRRKAVPHFCVKQGMHLIVKPAPRVFASEVFIAVVPSMLREKRLSLDVKA